MLAVRETVAQSPAIQLGHDHIGNDEMQVRVGEDRHSQGFFAVPRLEGSIPGVPQLPSQNSPHEVFVLGDQDDAGIGACELTLGQKETQGWGRDFDLKLRAGKEGAQGPEPATSSLEALLHVVGAVA